MVNQFDNNLEFVRSIEQNLKGVEAFSIGHGDKYCDLCPEDVEDQEVEFSVSSCDSCYTGLAGYRHYAHGSIDGEVVHFEVCTDCAMYHANDEVPFDEE